MERYTYYENGKWRLRIGDTEHSGPEVDRLAAYEETGFKPQEIKSLEGEWSVCKHVVDDYRASGLTPADLPRAAELVKAEAEAALSAQKCSNADCPYQERTDCPAADGCGGFEAALGGDGDG